MKKPLSIITICLLLCVTKANAQLNQLLQFAKNSVTNRIETNNRGEVERNYYNDDCIDYVLVRGNDAVYPLHPGKNTLMRLEKKDRINDPWKSNGQKINIYPGQLTKKKGNREIIYAMPVGHEKTVRCDMQEKYIHCNADSFLLNVMYFSMSSGETVHAIRSGVACQDVPNNILYIYHEDGSIAVYRNVVKNVKHNDRIIAGQPIGTVAAGKSNISILLLYISPGNLKAKEGLQFPYIAVLPKFRTVEGDIMIDHKLTATANTDNFVKTQELTAKEKKVVR